MSRTINYILILVGAIVAIYAKAGENQNQFILIGGIMILMLGIYRVSRTIPSKKDIQEEDQTSNNKP
ncbi:hypothetical protein [uncultured Psychroserpens sp.]|uniref:hypothetical protein n=1 Tax=uncultured Psychroserpens sp. TaxID=255436 RepID=UPI002607E2BC|nr:hypothetical protein [uncultured Psychroserpens sp.]